MKYTATYVEWDRDYHNITDREHKEEFTTVDEALQWQYKHGVDGKDYMLESIVLTKDGKEINVWEYTKPQSPDVEV